MEMNFNTQLTSKYHSKTQIARVLTEDWVGRNMFCPRCGNPHVSHFENNRPVADFYCLACNSEYELKSKNGYLGGKINDGAYDTMIKRITDNNNPDFFLMSYSKSQMRVTDFILIPKHFFVPDIIEKRRPLAPTSVRAGWVGCNILIDRIPQQGRISIISAGKVLDINNIILSINKSSLLEVNDIDSRGWLFDVLSCVNRISNDVFELMEVYQYEKILQQKHPNNNNIRAKIRQQLQILRDKGVIKFLGNGKYLKL